MGWILPPGGVVELTHTIARNLYARAPRELTSQEQDVVVAWVSGRAPVSEAEVRAALLQDWVAANEGAGRAFEQQQGGGAPASSTTQARSVTHSPLGVRLASATTTTSTAAPSQAATTPFSAEGRELTLWEGAFRVEDRATFDTLSKKGDLPGVGSMREVKLIITGASTDKPEVAFLNTNAYPTHHGFAAGALGASDSLQEFNARAYFDPARDVVCGSLVAVEGKDGQTTFALQFLPTDPMTGDLLRQAATLVQERAPFLKGALVYHPIGQGQLDVAHASTHELSQAGVSMVETKDLLANLTFQPLNQGVGFGVLRILDGSDPRPPTAKDVVIFTRLPNDLSHTAGVITLDPQTPLSHVNLKAKQNGTPNAYLQGADQLREVKMLLGSVVRFEVTAEGYSLRAATADEAASHMESLRPATSTTPPRDLTARTPQKLSSLSHADLAAFGAKTVNAAELCQILPAEQRMDGVGVPFAFYDDFMKQTGLYEAAQKMLAEPRFATDETYRNNRLKHFRRQLRDTPMPAALRQQVQDIEAGFPPGTALRLRSSTNNEDLDGFNGAGLYSSRTWDPSAAPSAQKQSFGDVMKDVWSSLWSFRAFEERTFHRIDHFATAMGVLVHPSYDNDGAAGVAVTKNIYDEGAPGLYVNVQPTDDAVTSPEGGAIPEELLLLHDARSGRYEPHTLRHSNLVDHAVMTSEQLAELALLLERIEQHFRQVLGAQGKPRFAMDVEFIVDDGRVRILQARPWVDGASSASQGHWPSRNALVA